MFKLPFTFGSTASGDSAVVQRLDLLLETQRETNILLERLVAQESSGRTRQKRRRLSDASASRSNGRLTGAARRKGSRQQSKGETKRSPGLHDEIEAVLVEAGHPLPANVIADRIRERGNYTPPRSSKPLSGSNVNSRVANPTYKTRFVRRDDGIWLSTREDVRSSP